MISWIQKKLMENGKWLFILLLIVVIFAFVPYVVPGLDPFAVELREDEDFYGYEFPQSEQDHAAQRRLQEVGERVALSQWMRTGSADAGASFPAVLERIALLGEVKKLGVPEPTDDQLAQFMGSRRAFVGKSGQSNQAAVTSFMDQVEAHPRYSKNMATSVLVEDWRIDQVRNAINGPGYFLRHQVLKRLQQEQTEYTISVATFPFNSFDAGEIELTEDELQTYYSNNIAQFTEPEQLKADIVLFPGDQHEVEVDEPTEQQLQSYFQRNKADFTPTTPEPAEGEEAPPAPEVKLDDVRDEVVEAVKEQERERLQNTAAMRAAGQFVKSLHNEGKPVPRDSDEFQIIASDYNVEPIPLPEFSRGNPPQGLPVPDSAFAKAWDLNKEQYFSRIPAETEAGAVVFLFDERIPARPMEFSEVEAEVREQFLEQRRMEAFQERGKEIAEALRTAVEEEGSPDFAEKAQELGLVVETYVDFTRTTPPEGLPRQLLSNLVGMNEGEISPMVALQQNGHFIHVQNKVIPALDTLSEDEVEQELNMLRMLATYQNRGGTIASFIDAELERQMPAMVEQNRSQQQQ